MYTYIYIYIYTYIHIYIYIYIHIPTDKFHRAAGPATFARAQGADPLGRRTNMFIKTGTHMDSIINGFYDIMPY